MPRVVIDPGVLISARLSPRGAPAELLVAWLAGDFTVIVSPALLSELEGVLARPKFRRYLSEEQAHAFVHELGAHAEVVSDPIDVPAGLTSDPKDDYLVALARAAHADMLISGDSDLVELLDPEPPVLTPRAFLATLEDE